jgi:hypothetical protein
MRPKTGESGRATLLGRRRPHNGFLQLREVSTTNRQCLELAFLICKMSIINVYIKWQVRAIAINDDCTISFNAWGHAAAK